jgi:hypothetical protein
LDGLSELGPADHVCWVVGSDDDYSALARVCVADGRAAGDKVFVFGPDASARPEGDVVADPFVIGLDRGPLRPAAMLDTFRRESAAAVAEGYRGVRVVADMDWVLSASPTPDDVTAFEIELDVANVATFALALATLGRPHSRLTLSLGELGFIDVAGMSALAEVASSTPGLRVRLVDASPVFRRCWVLAGFDAAVAGVELAE